MQGYFLVLQADGSPFVRAFLCQSLAVRNTGRGTAFPGRLARTLAVVPPHGPVSGLQAIFKKRRRIFGRWLFPAADNKKIPDP